MRISGAGHALFASTLVALGLWGLIHGDFAPIWQPVPKGAPAREALALLCGTIALLAGAGLLWRRTVDWASRLLVTWLLLWMLIFRGRVILQAPLAAVSWEGWGETAVLAAAAWTLYARFAVGWDRLELGFATGEAGQRIARAIYGLAMTAFGAAHLAYVKETASLVPAWLPGHGAWVYFTGAAYIAAGAAMVLGVFARLAATLSAVQIGLFTLLVWAPALAAGSKDPSVWSEAAISWALTTGAWVVAEAYGGSAWLGFRKS